MPTIDLLPLFYVPSSDNLQDSDQNYKLMLTCLKQSGLKIKTKELYSFMYFLWILAVCNDELKDDFVIIKHFYFFVFS